MDNDEVLNSYGEPATHQDCLDYHLGNCKGAMEYYEALTGNKMLRCEHHAWQAYNRQDKIKSEYWHSKNIGDY